MQQIRINDIKIIRMNSDAKKMKYYHISKNYSKLLVNFLAMITQSSSMSINEIMILLYQNNNKLELIT